jgi:signal transduction histidine kinase
MTMVFSESSFYSQLITPDIHEIWMRFIGMFIIIIFSIITQSTVNKHRSTENKLFELGSRLEQIVDKRTLELEKVNDRLQKQIDQKVEFTRTLVHELKTPLTPMIGASEILIEKTKDDKVLSRISRNINRGALNLNRRISDLSDLAKGEIGLLTIYYKPFDLLQMIKDLVDYVKISIERKNQSIALDLPPSFPTVWADEDRIRQVILNLLDNAMKFTPKNGKIFIKVNANEESCMVHIKDNGCGIAIKDQKHLFELYWCSNDNEKELSGLGIGLPLSKMIIELHGGKIWFESEKDKQSIFSFSIPMVLPRTTPGKEYSTFSETK